MLQRLMKKVLRLLPTCVAMNSKVGDTHELRWKSLLIILLCRVQFTVNKVTHKDTKLAKQIKTNELHMHRAHMVIVCVYTHNSIEPSN